MNTFEGVLSDHRRALLEYLGEWQRQQESILSKYACCMQEGGRQVILQNPQTAKSSGEVVEEAGALFSEHAVFGERPPVSKGIGRSEVPFASDGSKNERDAATNASLEPVADSPQAPLENNEIEGIRTMVSASSLDLAKDTLFITQDTSGGCLKAVVESWEFNIAISVVILGNVLFMAIAADHVLESAQSGRRATDASILISEVAFTCIYVIELCLKLACYGKRFFFGFEWQWHVFDLIVVVSALLDLLMSLFIGDAINVSFLRVNRLIKLVKMLRVVTIYRTFRELRLIIASILGCARTMFWAIALLGTVLLTFSLLFVQAVTDYVKANMEQGWNADITMYWGSTSQAMITLFQSSTGGEDWAKVADPLWQLGWVYYLAFMLYICFFMFIVVNILTALFVDAALDHSKKDDIMVVREELQNTNEYVEHIKSLYRRLDQDGSGELSWEELCKGLHHPDMLVFASSLGIEISDIHEFFRLISADGRDVVDLESFVVGCVKLKGTAKNLDVVSLQHRTKYLEQAMANFAGTADMQFAEVKRLLDRVLCEQERTKEAVQSPFCIEQNARPICIEQHGPWNLAWTQRPRRFSLLAPDFDVPQ